MPECLSRVERHGHVRRILLADDFVQSVQESVDRRGVHTVFVGEPYVVQQGVVGAIDYRVSIDQEKFFHGCCQVTAKCG